MTERLPPLDAAALTPEQRAAVEAFRRTRKGLEPFGPYVPLLRSPEVMQLCAALGHYLRHECALGHRLTELAILITARSHHQVFEWSVHAVEAEKRGLAAGIVAAIGEGRRPDGMDADAALVHDAAVELERTKGLSDTTYAALLARFGEQGVVDLCALAGYYGLLALVLNVARTPAEPGGARLRALPG
jgi:4-carboxymuconolactone decarboxylase